MAKKDVPLALAIGFACFFAGRQSGDLAGAQPGAVEAATPRRQETGRMVVGLTRPATPDVIKQIAKDLRAQIVNVSPRGAYVLVLPRPGTTAKELARRSREVAYVEPEIVMGISDPDHDFVLVIPMYRRLPGKVVGPPADIRPVPRPQPETMKRKR